MVRHDMGVRGVKVQVRMSAAERAALNAAARVRGVSASELIRGQLAGVLRSSVGRTGSSGPEPRGGAAEAVRKPEGASEGRFLPDAGWISRRTRGEVSVQKAEEALRAGRVEYDGGRLRVNGEVY